MLTRLIITNAGFCTNSSTASFLELLYAKSQLINTPFFTVQSDKIVILKDPLDFYCSINKQIKKATYRVGISSLYLGTGPLERYILAGLIKRLKALPSFEARLVFDYNRSMRIQKGESSVQMISSNIPDDLKHRIRVGLNRQSKSNNLIIGQINGVHHQKVAIFDDNVLIGGANLSHNYFVNRKDRYYLIKDCPQLADYFYDYLRAISENCHQLKDSEGKLSKQANIQTHYKLWKHSYAPSEFKKSFREQYNWLKKQAKAKQQEQENYTTKPSKKETKSKNIQLSEALGSDIKQYIPLAEGEIKMRKQRTRERLFRVSDENDVGNCLIEMEDVRYESQVQEAGQQVHIFPFIQFPKLGQTKEPQVLATVLGFATDNKIPIKISSGYMNFSEQIKGILKKSRSQMEVLCSSPEANSFYRGGRLKQYIPYLYRNIQARLLKQCGNNLKIKEYNDNEWSFHAKGIWLKKGVDGQYLTVIGSSNYNYRSQARDTEMQLYICSTCQKLNKRLDKQWNEIASNCKLVDLQKIKSDGQIKNNTFWELISRIFARFL